jgi:OmpA-OmpF porin, OOP family
LTAEKIRFSKDDLETARALDSRVAPVEGRVTQVEAQNEVLSGQVDELNEVSKTMRSDIDVNKADISRTNERISALDDYLVQDLETVYFKVNSAVLSPEGTAALDGLAQKALATKGYMIEVTGFADSTGNTRKNRVLSQNRADAVVRYLAETYDIPLRRMITPFGYGDLKPIADNTSTEGRSQNRRVEVKILVNRGLTNTTDTAVVSTTP